MRVKTRRQDLVEAEHCDCACAGLSAVSLAVTVVFTVYALQLPLTQISCFHHSDHNADSVAALAALRNASSMLLLPAQAQAQAQAGAEAEGKGGHAAVARETPPAAAEGARLEDIDCLIAVRSGSPLLRWMTGWVFGAGAAATGLGDGVEEAGTVSVEVRSADIEERCRNSSHDTPLHPELEGGRLQSLRHHNHHVHPHRCLFTLMIEDEGGGMHKVHDFSSRSEAHRALAKIQDFIHAAHAHVLQRAQRTSEEESKGAEVEVKLGEKEGKEEGEKERKEVARTVVTENKAGVEDEHPLEQLASMPARMEGKTGEVLSAPQLSDAKTTTTTTHSPADEAVSTAKNVEQPAVAYRDQDLEPEPEPEPEPTVVVLVENTQTTQEQTEEEAEATATTASKDGEGEREQEQIPATIDAAQEDGAMEQSLLPVQPLTDKEQSTGRADQTGVAVLPPLVPLPTETAASAASKTAESTEADQDEDAPVVPLDGSRADVVAQRAAAVAAAVTAEASSADAVGALASPAPGSGSLDSEPTASSASTRRRLLADASDTVSAPLDRHRHHHRHYHHHQHHGHLQQQPQPRRKLQQAGFFPAPQEEQPPRRKQQRGDGTTVSSLGASLVDGADTPPQFWSPRRATQKSTAGVETNMQLFLNVSSSSKYALYATFSALVTFVLMLFPVREVITIDGKAGICAVRVYNMWGRTVSQFLCPLHDVVAIEVVEKEQRLLRGGTADSSLQLVRRMRPSTHSRIVFGLRMRVKVVADAPPIDAQFRPRNIVLADDAIGAGAGAAVSAGATTTTTTTTSAAGTAVTVVEYRSPATSPANERRDDHTDANEHGGGSGCDTPGHRRSVSGGRDQSDESTDRSPTATVSEEDRVQPILGLAARGHSARAMFASSGQNASATTRTTTTVQSRSTDAASAAAPTTDTPATTSMTHDTLSSTMGADAASSGSSTASGAGASATSTMSTSGSSAAAASSSSSSSTGSSSSSTSTGISGSGSSMAQSSAAAPRLTTQTSGSRTPGAAHHLLYDVERGVAATAGTPLHTRQRTASGPTPDSSPGLAPTLSTGSTRSTGSAASTGSTGGGVVGATVTAATATAVPTTAVVSVSATSVERRPSRLAGGSGTSTSTVVHEQLLVLALGQSFSSIEPFAILTAAVQDVLEAYAERRNIVDMLPQGHSLATLIGEPVV